MAADASLDGLRVLVRLIRQWTLVGVSSREDEVERCSALQTALADLIGSQTSRLEVDPLSAWAVRVFS